MDIGAFLPIIAFIVGVLILLAVVQIITWCLYPGRTTGWAEKCGFKCKPPTTPRKRSRFLSIYDIYNPSDTKQEARKFENLFAIAKARAEANASRIDEGAEGMETDLPPSYDQVVRVLDNDNPNPHINTIIV